MTQPRVVDIVRDMLPFVRNRMSAEEHNLAVHLRGNEKLYEALTTVIRVRLEGRARRPVPSDPAVCMATMASNAELQWILSRLEFVYRSPVTDPVDNSGEQPA